MPKKPRNWKEDVDAIRKVLMSEWDPIGCGAPDDEYDGYIPVIYRLMQARVSVEELASHLTNIETESMGLSGGRAVERRNRRVAESLRGPCHRATGTAPHLS
jgi:hypothetical protein